MTSYMYVSYRHHHPNIEEYSTFEEALQNFVSDFDSGEAYGIGIYQSLRKGPRSLSPRMNPKTFDKFCSKHNR